MPRELRRAGRALASAPVSVPATAGSFANRVYVLGELTFRRTGNCRVTFLRRQPLLVPWRAFIKQRGVRGGGQFGGSI